jgi:toxin ParE1/3/4
MPKYKLSESAKEDLIRIFYYGLNKFGEKQAEKYYFHFFEKFDEISKNPYLYPSVNEIRPGYRKCVCGVDTIYFRINEEYVEIMAIIGKQEFKN